MDKEHKEMTIVSLSGADCAEQAAKILRRYHDGKMPQNAREAMQDATMLTAGSEALKDAAKQMEIQLARRGYIHDQVYMKKYDQRTGEEVKDDDQRYKL